MSNTQTDLQTDAQQKNAEQLVRAFESFESWEERYSFLISMGRKLPPLDDADRTEENRVHGCQSNVWVVAHPQQQSGEEVIDFVADSDSTLVKGLIAILRKIYSGQTPSRVLAFDIEGLFERLDLNQHLSMGRRNGLYGMVQRIKILAARHAPNGTA